MDIANCNLYAMNKQIDRKHLSGGRLAIQWKFLHHVVRVFMLISYNIILYKYTVTNAHYFKRLFDFSIVLGNKVSSFRNGRADIGNILTVSEEIRKSLNADEFCFFFFF